MSLVWSETLANLDWQELSALYLAAPLGHKTPEDLKLAFSHSMYMCFVRENGKLVGVGRVLADGVYVAYVADIAVLPSHQGTGLGKEIVAHLVDLCKHHQKNHSLRRAGQRTVLPQVRFSPHAHRHGDLRRSKVGADARLHRRDLNRPKATARFLRAGDCGNLSA